jgi:hypothetical protein
MDNFILKMREDPEMTRPLQELLQLITEVIGNTYGAIDAFFNRTENRVFALPPKGNIRISEIELNYPSFPLRLYCLALSEELVICSMVASKMLRRFSKLLDRSRPNSMRLTNLPGKFNPR